MPRNSKTRTVRGIVRLPNGVQGSQTGQASAVASVDYGGVQMSFETNTGMGYGYGPGGPPYCSVTVTYFGLGPSTEPPEFQREDVQTESFYLDGYPLNGRGIDGDFLEFTYAFAGTASPQVTTYGKQFPEGYTPAPRELYPDYGGAPEIGGYPEHNAKVHFGADEPVNHSALTITMGPKTIALTLTDAFLPSSVGAGVYVTDDSFTDHGLVPASIRFEGVPVEMPFGAMQATYYGRHDGNPDAPEQVAATFTCSAGHIEVANAGWIRQSVLEASGVGFGANLTIPSLAAVSLDAMAMDRPHPYPCRWYLTHKYRIEPPGGNGGQAELVPVVAELNGQQVGYDVRQGGVAVNYLTSRNKSITREERSGNWVPYYGHWPPNSEQGPAQSYAAALWEFGPVSAYVVPPPGEDPSDWRVGFRGAADGGLSVSRSDRLPIELPEPTTDGAGLTVYDFGSKPSVWEGYRYAEVAIPEGGGTSLAVNGKSWSVAPGATKTIDLCFPDAGPPEFTVDRQDTRWPLDDKRLSTIDSPTWGVSVAWSLTSGGAVSSVTLKDEGPTRLHFLAPFGPPWEQEVPDDVIESQGDTYTVEHYCARLAIGDVAGRQGFEVPHVRWQVNNAPGRRWPDDYFHLGCSTLAQLINEIPGWTARSYVDEDGVDPSAWFVGQGYVREGGAWTKQWDLAPGGGLVKAQPVYDSVEWRDQVGDVFDVGIGGGAVLGLVGRKVFRGAAYGATDRDGKVLYSDLGTGTTDEPPAFTATTEGKRYLVGPTLSLPNDWGRVWSKPDHKASVGGYPRRIERAALRIVAPSRGGLAYDVSPSFRHYRASLPDGTIVVKATTNLAPFEGEERASTTAAEWIRVRSERVGRTAWLRAMYGDGADVCTARSLDEGKTYEDEMTIGTGGYGDFESGLNGLRWFYWVEGGAVKYALYDRLMTLLDSGDTNVADAADAPIAVRESTGSGGQWRMGLYYQTAGGDRSFLTADDGKTFE